MDPAKLIVATCLLQTVLGYYTLKQLSHTQLATSINKGTRVYGGINLGTATDAAYDPVNNIIYIIGETSHLMHVVDIADPTNPSVLFIHEFTKGDGVPRSIDVCGDQIAVALAAQTDVNEGHVRFYQTHTRGSVETNVIADTHVTVGPHPNHLKYTRDCGSVIVANEGIAGKDESGTYVNPEGSVTVIHGERTGNPSVRLVDFKEFDVGQPKYDLSLRAPSKYIPTNVLSPSTLISQDIEPEYVTISSDGRTAYVTLQENDAIAQVNLYNGVIDKISPLPRKSWDAHEIDASDRDGGVHRRPYTGLQSLRQPGVIKLLEVGRKRFVITADEGAIKSYTNNEHGFTWTDAALARTQAGNIDPADLKENANNDEKLGRLQVSTVDGKDYFTNAYQHLEAFGGRGFSIWDTSNYGSPTFDSHGTLEQYMEGYEKSTFNTDYIKNMDYKSPEGLRDSVSYKQGAQVTGMDIAEDNGTIFLVVGTSSTGTLYTYTVNVTTGLPIPSFQSITRSGVADIPWKDTYQNKAVGDLYITDIGIIPSDHSPTNSPLVYVTSKGAGALSLYSLQYQSDTIPGPIKK